MRFSHMSWAKKSRLNKEPSISQQSDISCICYATDSHQAKPWKYLLKYLLLRYVLDSLFSCHASQVVSARSIQPRSLFNCHERCQGILNYSRITYIVNKDTHDFISLLYRVVHPNPPSPAVRYTTSIKVLIDSFHASRYTCLILFSNSPISMRHRFPMNDL